MKYKQKIIEYGISCADPLPTLKELKEYYEEQYYQNADGTTTYEATYTEEELAHKKLESNLALFALKEQLFSTDQSVSLIEFGCGEGFFLKQVASQTDWNARGIDFSEFGVKKWHPELLDICEFGDSYDHLNSYIKQSQTFDICVLRNVLEHVIDPQKLLKDLKKLLSENGLLLITVPNDYSLLQMQALESNLVDHAFWFLPPDHLYYFNTENLTHFVEAQGYKVIDMFSSFPVDFFLFHPGSNYIKNKNQGKEAHFARIKLDLLMAQSGFQNLLNVYRAMVKCGIGRDITVILKPL